MRYSSIVPLIGGETIAMQQVFGKRPEVIWSYSPFETNDSQLLEYYNHEVPYNLIDALDPISIRNAIPVDVVNAVCPCSGLSSLSVSSSSDNKANDWMLESARHVLMYMKPKVFWGENAPRLATKMGEPIVAQLREIAEAEGYTMTLYKTKSLLHGLSQVRDRSFYFFWRETESVPLLSFFRRTPHERIEDTIRNAFVSKDDPMNVLVRDQKPSDDLFYKYVLEVIHGGISHADFSEEIDRSTNVMCHIEAQGHNYEQVSNWVREQGNDRLADRCLKIHAKLSSGGNVMRKTTEVPKDHIGAFVGHLPGMLTHPDEDRYLTIRECLAIMGMPDDFILQGGARNLNMICQNVPVSTARDMAKEIQTYLDGNAPMIPCKFAVQDNKSMTNFFEKEPSNLTGFLK